MAGTPLPACTRWCWVRLYQQDLMKNIEFRPARSSDVPALCVIEQQSFTSDTLSKQSFVAAVKSSSQMLLVATAIDEVPIGYVLVHFRKNSDKVRIYSLAVLRAWRTHGVASKLLDMAVAAAEKTGCKSIMLEARKQNLRLVEFYLRHRFTPQQLLPGYYQDGADAIRMTRPIAALSAPTDKNSAKSDRPATIVVVPRQQDVTLVEQLLVKRRSLAIITVQDYMSFVSAKDYAPYVINLCPGDEYLSSGYYVSLVAAARGSKVLPAVDTLSNLEIKRIYSEYLAELTQLIPDAGKAGDFASAATGDTYSLELYFGHTDLPWARRLAKRCYQLFPVPILEIMLHRRKDRWEVDYVWPLSIVAVDPVDRPRFIKSLTDSMGASISAANLAKRYQFDLAVLVDPDEALPPSNSRALLYLTKAARGQGLHTEIITKTDLKRLEAFDALFIRTTTGIAHFTYQFASKAVQLGLPVIDDPKSILRCSNKVFLAEALERAGLDTPRTILLTRANLRTVLDRLQFPLVLKVPDGSFSRGVIKVESTDAFLVQARKMLDNSYMILAQEYLPKAFDWRVGILNGTPLFASQYFMARGHWQIYHHQQNKRVVSGGFETVAIDQVPPKILQSAISAGLSIGDGLYGVDLKDIDGRSVVIEVNDNPNIDAGVEDMISGPEIYDRLASLFHQRILQVKGLG